MSLNPEVKCWSEVAAKLGGQVQIRNVFKGPRQHRRRFGLPTLSVSLGGVTLHGEVTGEGDPPATFSQLSTAVPGAEGLTLRIYRNYLYPQFGRAVGIQDLVTGDALFDRNFIVKSNDPQYARLWLGHQARREMLSAPDYCFEIDGERAVATSHRADDPAQLEACLRGLAHLATRGDELTTRVIRLARRLDSESSLTNGPWLSGNPGFEFISGGRRVALSFVHSGTGRRGNRKLLSRLWCRRVTARSDRFVFFADHLSRKERPILASKLARCDLGKLHPAGFVVHASSEERLRSRMSDRWARIVLRLNPLVLSCSEAAVELVWSGAVLAEGLLRDGAELCEYFAIERREVVSAGPYR